MRGVITSLKNKEPALNRGLTGECPTRTWPPPGFGQGGGKEPALNRGRTGECPTRTWPPLGFGQGGGKEPTLNRGRTGECPTPDLAPHLVSNNGRDRQPVLNSGLTSDLFVWGDVGLCLSYYKSQDKSLRPAFLRPECFGGVRAWGIGYRIFNT
jgi:hypothetical protein